MPLQARNLLNLTIAISLAGFLTSLVLTGLLSRLGDDAGTLWIIRAGYCLAILLVVALACGHLGRATGGLNNETGTRES